MIKNINSKMTTNSQLSTTEPKRKLSKQLEQEQNHRNGDHMEGYQHGGGGRRIREKVEGIRSINGRYQIDRGRWRNAGGRGSTVGEGDKGESKMGQL